jgi:hypothetical protein
MNLYTLSVMVLSMVNNIYVIKLFKEIDSFFITTNLHVVNLINDHFVIEILRTFFFKKSASHILYQVRSRVGTTTTTNAEHEAYPQLAQHTT